MKKNKKKKGVKEKGGKVKRTLEIVRRSEWGAVPPRGLATPLTNPMLLPIERTIFTYDVGVEECKTREDCILAMVQLQRHYMEDLGLDDIPYNFLIGEDGVVYEGRGWYCKSDKKLQKPKFHKKGRRLDVAYIANYKSLPFERIDTGYDLMCFGVKKKIVREYYSFFEIEKNKLK